MAKSDDFHYYAERIGQERWTTLPRQNKWSFESHLWHVTKQAIAQAKMKHPLPISYFIDHGKEHIGCVAESIFLLNDPPA